MRNTNAKNFVLLTIIVLGLLFLSGFGCQKGEEPTAPDASVSEVPEGWKVYESERLNLSLAYPPDWNLVEDERLGILLSETPLSQPLPPDLAGVSIINIAKSNISEAERIETLQEIDQSLKTDEVQKNQRDGKLYIYWNGFDNREERLYRFPISNAEFVEMGASSNISLSILESVLNTLSF